MTSRQTDPETSQIAAGGVKGRVSTLQTMFCKRALAWHSRYYRWPTAQEIAGGSESLRKRAGECVRLGYVRLGEIRRCTVTGKKAQTYEVIE